MTQTLHFKQNIIIVNHLQRLNECYCYNRITMLSSIVFRFCNYQQDGLNFIVHHGERFVHRQNCTRCRCRDGSATSCRVDSRVICRALNPGDTPQDCRRGNTRIPHGTSAMVGLCNVILIIISQGYFVATDDQF